MTRAPDVEPPEDAAHRESPWWPYLSAHVDDDDPKDVLGGPIEVTASQEQGTVNWVLPGKRKLDPAVFGTADNPKGAEQPAMLLGAPPPAREPADSGGQRTAQPTPFSDKAEQVEGSVDMTVVDATATDEAVTKDQIDFEARFTAPDGADYRVVVERPAPHGWFIPTAGGVVTNFIQHGVTGWGTRLMPTEYDDAAFYGPGTIYRNGEKIAENRPTHMMLTEFVRGEGYSLVTDEGVNPGSRHLHLMVSPFDQFGSQDPVSTGFELPNDQEQPFLHIMYPGGTAEGDAPAFDGELPDGIREAGQVPALEQPPEGEPYRESPWWPYLSAHVDDDPKDVLAGPLAVQGQQEQGTVNWVLPGKRKLDPAVFGTADNPKGAEQPAMLLGAPPPAREPADSGGQRTAQPTPFSDKAEQVEGSVDMTLIDATATDAATTEDRVDFEATFTSPDGADYRVVIDKAASHGTFVPTAGGVVTNFIQHGVTGWGTRLMPTEYDDAALYGVATIFRDGERVAEGRPAHVMVTEFVRGEGYSLVTDEGVNPGSRHLHLMVSPFDRLANQDPVSTGFELPNGQEQPFLHIMYPGFEWTAAGALE